MNLPILLSAIGVTLYAISFLTCLTMILLISFRIRPFKTNVAVFVVFNTYCNCFLVSSMMLMMYSYTLIGNLHPSTYFGGQWCRWRIYLVHVCFCSLYYSFVLQAVFRLFRIVFYRFKVLQSFGVCLLSVVIQWILSFLFILPNLLLDDFRYQASEFNCWIAFDNVRGLILVTLTIFNNPLSIIFTIYTQIIRYTRRQAHLQQRRQNANQRDLAVLKRIVILVFIIVIIGLPTLVVIIVYLITNRIIPYAYHIQGLCIALGVLVASISLVFLTPQLQQIFRKSYARIQPHHTLTMAVVQERIF